MEILGMGTTTTEMKMFPAAKSQGELEGNLIETREENQANTTTMKQDQ